MKRESLSALVAILGLCLATAPGAPAKKVKREVKLTDVGSFINDGSTIRFEDRLSGNRRCVKALTAQSIVFLTKARRDLDPNAQVVAVEGGGFSVPSSQPQPVQRHGPGHASATFSNGQSLTFLHASGAYGGTYTLLKWWRGLGIEQFFPPRGSFPDLSFVSIVRAGQRDGFKTKVKFKRAGTKYVLRCEIELAEFPLNPPNPPSEGFDPGPFPVPGTYRFGTR